MKAEEEQVPVVLRGRGGPGRGQGRKPLPPEQHLKRRQVQLSEGQIAVATRLGDGNLSAGIRRAIQEYS